MKCGRFRTLWTGIISRAPASRVPEMTSLLDLADLLHGIDQAGAVGLDEFCKLRRVEIGDRTAGGLKGLDHLGRLHGIAHRAAQLRHDRLGQGGWAHKALPRDST